ncbi:MULTISPECIES: bifunctional DNA primase/polymerase [unclassified Streptomyces]|uniref:bifunctional DNA primase/polymerase n=1 Tax=unclassified Streptomyces TaxID=2593676 RepID=UPI002DD9D6EE|nr:bifunctional DNA primase/polymerase [Streptomyces sp. NBC_01237]WRZ78675.1 bifunctional DNA primase/polymerase [Streptomyces sp. NBC_01237]
MASELRVADLDSSRPAPVPPALPSAVTTARWCAEQGWPVHPLAAGRKTPAGNCDACRRPGHTHRGCGCAAEGRWCHGFHAATCDPDRIAQWWGSNPEFGVGVSCGPAGLVVIDIDAHPQGLPERDRLLPGILIPEQVDLTGLTHGFHTLAVLAALRGAPDPAADTSTLRVRTPSGGLHVWYRAPDARAWQCSTGSGNGRALAWQVDVRAHGGYIIAPGTTTAAGRYTALGTTRRPALLPGWLAQELERTGHLPQEPLPGPRPVPSRARQAVIAAGGGRERTAGALSAVLAEVTACAAVAEGAGFSEKLNRASYTAGGLVTAGHLTHEQAEQILQSAAAVARPGQDRRAAQIIRSGMSAGSRRPLYLGRNG